MQWLATIRKALLAAALAAVAAAVPAYPNGFTAAEVATIAGAAIIAGIGVYSVKNSPEGPA